MRNKILRKTVIGMAIAMFIISVAIVGSFVVVSMNDTETEVKEFAEPLVDQISRLEDLNRLEIFVANKHGSSIRITIFNSNGEAIGDTFDRDQLISTTLDFDAQIESILVDNIGATRAKYDRTYQTNTYRMFTYYVKVQVPNKVDKDNFLIVRFSKSGVVGSSPFIIFIVALSVFWTVVVVTIAVLFSINIKATMEPLSTVQGIMSDIREGTYKRSTTSKYLVPSEADKMLEEIDKLGAVINDTMHNLNVLLESITQGIVAFNNKGDILFSNSKAYEFFGVEVLNDDHPSKDFVKKYAHEYELFKNSLKTKVTTTFDNEVKGRYLHVETIFPPQEEGMDMYMLMVATDVTEQVKTTKAKQEFFANASHELKTPLTAIAGYSEILTMSKPTEKQITKCSAEIQQNALRMKALIEEMLQLSKLDAQAGAQEKEEISLRNLCEETIDELRVIAKKHNISITIDGEATLEGNYKEIMMVVKNLISNAVKYNKEDGYVKVKISEKDDNVVISVKDNGLGISKEDQDKIFDRFFRVDSARSTTNEESSTGLGLAIVKHVVENHKGTIKVVSELNKGSEFIVTLPKR